MDKGLVNVVNVVNVFLKKNMTTIVDLLQADGIRPVLASGDEHHSPCPVCGGRDRFSSFPNAKNRNGVYAGGRFVCRRCGWHGDAVQYLITRHGMSFREAVEAIGAQFQAGQGRNGAAAPAGWTPTEKPEPPEAWQKRAASFLSCCIQELQQNGEALHWLQTSRGLSIETVKRFRLGLNPEDRWFARAEWGLPEAVGLNGRPKRLWIPRGLIISYFPGGKTVRLRVRRTNPGDGARYVVVSGSSCRPMVIGQSNPAVVVVESELDGLLLAQEAADLIDVVAMGSAQAKPDTALDGRLNQASLVLIALDNDEAGEKATAFWKRYPGFQRWPPFKGKDPCEMLRAGVSVREWVETGLRRG